MGPKYRKLANITIPWNDNYTRTSKPLVYSLLLMFHVVNSYSTHQDRKYIARSVDIIVTNLKDLADIILAKTSARGAVYRLSLRLRIYQLILCQ